MTAIVGYTQPSIIAESFTVTYYNVSIELFAFKGNSGRKKGREGGRKEGEKDRRVFDSS